jgi:DNA topoisomerase I
VGHTGSEVAKLNLEGAARAHRRAARTLSAPSARRLARTDAVPDAPPEPHESAAAAGLHYVRDTGPGIRRRRSGKGFRYVDANGRAIRDRGELARIRSLAVPPAWTDVWICPLANGHLQATGRDAKGRKQHRYHPRWRAVRDETKYDRLIDFAKVLPAIRARTEKDLALPGLPRDKVLATVVRLLETTLIRVGNEEYARANRSFGLTTLRDSHVDISGSKLEFRFRGKSGREHVVGVQDRRLSRIVKRCQDVPGYQLFQYLDENGRRRSIESADVNDYLREITGASFTAKDFRTWAGTVLAAWALHARGAAGSARQATKNVARAIESVAERLGNTPAVCRKCYVHPVVVDAYVQGALAECLDSGTARRVPRRGLSREEALVLDALIERLRGSSNAHARRGSTAHVRNSGHARGRAGRM